MPTTYPLEIWTIRSYVEQGYTASLWCDRCHAQHAPPDLVALLKAGHGDKPLRDLELECPRHRCALRITIHSTPGFGHR